MPADIPTAPKFSNGQIVMNVGFNPNQRNDVAYIKDKCAQFYDKIELFIQMKLETPEVLKDGNKTGMVKRLTEIAKTHLETYQMLAVEALTETADMSDMEPVKFNSPTPGDRFMKLDFNIGNRKDIDMIKSMSSNLYDYLNSETVKRGKSLESKAQLDPTISLKAEERKLDAMANLVVEAQNYLRLVRMFTVKALTR